MQFIPLFMMTDTPTVRCPRNMTKAVSYHKPPYYIGLFTVTNNANVALIVLVLEISCYNVNPRERILTL